MEYILCTIYDDKAQTYSSPMTFINDQVAIRSCEQVLDDPNNQITQNPEDFILFKIALFDPHTGEVQPMGKYKPLCRFHEIQRPVRLVDTTDPQAEQDHQEKLNNENA